jgi:C-terminal processing protease CtpA/Prc
VAAVASKNGKATVEGVRPGDKLIRIDRLETTDATWGQIYDALHGKPGETRVLILSRGATHFTVASRVTRLLNSFALAQASTGTSRNRLAAVSGDTGE